MTRPFFPILSKQRRPWKYLAFSLIFFVRTPLGIALDPVIEPLAAPDYPLILPGLTLHSVDQDIGLQSIHDPFFIDGALSIHEKEAGMFRFSLIPPQPQLLVTPLVIRSDPKLHRQPALESIEHQLIIAMAQSVRNLELRPIDLEGGWLKSHPDHLAVATYRENFVGHRLVALKPVQHSPEELSCDVVLIASIGLEPDPLPSYVKLQPEVSAPLKVSKGPLHLPKPMTESMEISYTVAIIPAPLTLDPPSLMPRIPCVYQRTADPIACQDVVAVYAFDDQFVSAWEPHRELMQLVASPDAQAVDLSLLPSSPQPSLDPKIPSEQLLTKKPHAPSKLNLPAHPSMDPVSSALDHSDHYALLDEIASPDHQPAFEERLWKGTVSLQSSLPLALTRSEPMATFSDLAQIIPSTLGVPFDRCPFSKDKFPLLPKVNQYNWPSVNALAVVTAGYDQSSGNDFLACEVGVHPISSSILSIDESFNTIHQALPMMAVDLPELPVHDGESFFKANTLSSEWRKAVLDNAPFFTTKTLMMSLAMKISVEPSYCLDTHLPLRMPFMKESTGDLLSHWNRSIIHELPKIVHDSFSYLTLLNRQEAEYDVTQAINIDPRLDFGASSLYRDLLKQKALDYLSLMPTLHELKTTILTSDFHHDVEVIAAPDGLSYYFCVKVSPYYPEEQRKIHQNVYFVIDQSRTIAEERLETFKKSILRAIPYLGPDTSYNIIVLNKHFDLMSLKNISTDHDSSELAKNFLDKISYSFMASPQEYTHLINYLKNKFPAKERELNTVILLSDGAVYKNFPINKQQIHALCHSNPHQYQIYTVAAGQDNYLNALEMLAFHNDGQLLYSRTHAALPRQLAILVKNLRHPIATHLHISAIRNETDELNFFPPSGQLPALFADQPLKIYGKTSTLQNFDLMIQGKADEEWINISQSINLRQAKRGDRELIHQVQLMEKKLRYFQEVEPINET